jgi:hypothetical protein
MSFVLEFLIDVIGDFLIDVVVKRWRRKPKLANKAEPPRLERRVPSRRFNASHLS